MRVVASSSDRAVHGLPGLPHGLHTVQMRSRTVRDWKSSYLTAKIYRSMEVDLWRSFGGRSMEVNLWRSSYLTAKIDRSLIRHTCKYMHVHTALSTWPGSDRCIFHQHVHALGSCNRTPAGAAGSACPGCSIRLCRNSDNHIAFQRHHVDEAQPARLTLGTGS